MIDPVLTIVIENASFVAIFLVCIYGVAASQKHRSTLPGADLLLIGFLLYAMYGLLGWAAAGFNGSFITDYSRTAALGSVTAKYFITMTLRLGLILILVGIFRVAKGQKTEEG